jgi:FMN-dependent oxidoreductase (nitrilotriacetate monooxygenase family)
MPMGSGAHIAGWRHPLAGTSDLHSVQHYAEIARIAERGKFDAMFLADAQGFRPVASKDAFSRLDMLRMDPVTLLAAVSMATHRLGLIATLSTSYNEPYSAARRLATLDHVSGGRAGWNVVTSTTENEAHNFGRDVHYGHAERYARAAEFIDVARGLWDTWDDGSVQPDPAKGRYCDPDGIRALAHQGAFFRVEGPLTMGRSPQGHPVVVQAGASEDGLALAARSADAVFTSHPSLESAARFYRDLKDRTAANGRDPDSLKILTAIQPIVADSEAEAVAMAEELDALIHPELALTMLGMQFGGLDLSGYDPDGPMPPIPANNASKGSQQRIIEEAARGNLTLLQTARKVAAGRTSRTVSGTGTQVADLLDEWFAARAADGFVIAAPVLPGMLARFIDHVVPLLQARGLFRADYEGATLRDHLALPRPAPRRVGPEPEIWRREDHAA